MKTPFAVLVICLAVGAQAQSVTLREEMRDGRKPSSAFSLVAPNGVRMWGLGFNTKTPVWDVGWVTPKPLQVTPQLSMLVGGYVSYWQGEHRAYLEPWMLTKVRLGRWSTAAKLGLYLPVLAGGSWKLYSDHGECSYQATPRWSLGLAAGDAWLVTGKKPRIGIGVTSSVRVGTVTVLGRALHGINEPDSLRLEATTTF